MMKKLLSWSWPVFCITALALVGCAHVVQKNGGAPQMLSAPAGAASSADNEFLVFAQRFAAMSAEEQKKEYAMATLSLNRNKGNLSIRMKVAMMLALPSSRIRDNSRALAMLEEVSRDESASTETRSLAGLLKDYVGERLRLEENTGKLVQKAADEQKRADTMQQKADGLQQKLDELKNIEKALTDRDQAKPK